MTPANIINALSALIALLVIAGAGVSGWQLKASRCALEVAERERAAALRVVQEFRRIQRENEVIEQAWNARQQEIKSRHETLKHELRAVMPAHQRADGACNLGSGAVRVLNRAAGHPDPVPAPTRDAAGEAHAASGVTQLDLAGGCLAWAEQYERTAGQLNQLIDWTERNTHVAGRE